jgi:small subunit ribosomal protein S17
MRERRRTFTGRVVSNKMQKTVVVQVERTRSHPLYGKVIRVRNRFKAHADMPCNEGDMVKIIESRPISKEKHWMVAAVMKKGEVLALPEVVIPPSKEEKPNEAAAEAAGLATTSEETPA